jgi:hypothetical protein
MSSRCSFFFFFPHQSPACISLLISSTVYVFKKKKLIFRQQQRSCLNWNKLLHVSAQDHYTMWRHQCHINWKALGSHVCIILPIRTPPTENTKVPLPHKLYHIISLQAIGTHKKAILTKINAVFCSNNSKLQTLHYKFQRLEPDTYTMHFFFYTTLYFIPLITLNLITNNF